ncbi:MAG: NAD(P)/FAD-dependent oxidoreductase [Solirubrobacteraceae bacterium]
MTQARKFGARIAMPYRAVSLEPGNMMHRVELDEGREIVARAVLLATGADYRRLAIPDLERYEGLSIFYAAGPPEARACSGTRVGVIGGGNSAGQAAVWLARGGALVTLLHRRADLRETMSNYLVADLDRYGVTVRDRSEIAELHGENGELNGVTLTDGASVGLGSLFCFLGADPHTEWLGDTVARATTASSSRETPRVPRGSSRRASPASTPPATSAPARRSAARPQSARAPRWWATFTSDWRP